MTIGTVADNPYVLPRFKNYRHQYPVVESSLAESVVYLMLLSITKRVIGLARGLIVCMWLTPALLGPWDLANRFFFLAAPMLVLGLPGSFRSLSKYYRQRGVPFGQSFVARRSCEWSLVCVALR